MVSNKYMKERWHILISSALIGFAMISHIIQKGLTLSFDVFTLFYACIFFLLAASILNDLRKEMTEDYLVRDNIFLWFVTGFLGSRFLVATAGLDNSRAGELLFIPVTQIWIGGYHLHHFLWGLTIMTVSSILVLEQVNVSRTKIAAAFGLGLGMLSDEIGLLISMEDYSSTITYPIVAVMAALLYLNVERDLIKNLFKKVWKNRKFGLRS